VAVPLCDWAIGGHAGRTYRSVYRTGAPPASLAAAVDRFWVGEPGWPRGIRLLPDGCVDLVWTGRAVTVFPAGPAARRAVLPPAGRQVGARLRRGAAGALLGVDCAELDAAPLPLADLVAGSRRSAARRAEWELAQAGTDAAERAALGRLVDALWRCAGDLDPVVMAAAELLAAPDARVDRLGERLDVSPRALRRRVRAAVGIGPKRLHRVLRFRRFVGHLGQLADGRRGLAELAAELGYADQAHLGRECLQLAGASPAALVELYRRPVRGRGGPDETG
jgi:AraC-like DNA-binding protein